MAEKTGKQEKWMTEDEMIGWSELPAEWCVGQVPSKPRAGSAVAVLLLLLLLFSH